MIQCSAFLSRAHSTDIAFSAGPHVFTPPPLTNIDGTPMDCVYDSASETPCLDENMLPHFQFSIYWIGMQMMFPAVAAPFGLHPSTADDGTHTVTGIPNQHVLNRGGKRKVLSIAQALEVFGPSYQVPANQIRRSGVLAYAQHGGGSAGVGGFIPPQERDEDGRVPATVIASLALIILQSTDHCNTLIPGTASDSSGAMDRPGAYSCSTFDQSSDHEFSGPFTDGDPNPDGTLSIPVALRGSSGVPAASPTDMDAEVDNTNDSRRFDLFAAGARCLGDSPIHIGDSMIRMAVDSKHIGSGFLSEALWGQHVREQKLLELLSVYEAACAYIYQYVAPPNEAQQEADVPGTTFSVLCGQAMHPSVYKSTDHWSANNCPVPGSSPRYPRPTVQPVLIPEAVAPAELTPALIHTMEIAILLELASLQYLQVIELYHAFDLGDRRSSTSDRAKIMAIISHHVHGRIPPFALDTVAYISDRAPFQHGFVQPNDPLWDELASPFPDHASFTYAGSEMSTDPSGSSRHQRIPPPRDGKDRLDMSELGGPEHFRPSAVRNLHCYSPLHGAALSLSQATDYGRALGSDHPVIAQNTPSTVGMVRLLFPVLPDTPFATPISLQGPLSDGVPFQSATAHGPDVHGVVQRYNAGSIRSVPFAWLPVSLLVAHCGVNFDRYVRLDPITLSRCIQFFKRKRSARAGRDVRRPDGGIATGDGRYCFEGAHILPI